MSISALPWVVLSVMLFGLLGVLIPILPGLVIIWIAALVFGIINGFTLWGGVIFGVISVLMIIGTLIDNVIMGKSARQTGASWLSIAVALVAGVVGSLVWPPLGGLFAAMLGIFLVEYFRLRDIRKALVSTKSMAIGCGWAVVVRFVIGLVMIGLYLVWAFML